MSDRILKCGCSAQAKIKRPGEDWVEGCGVHMCSEFLEEQPNLEGRMAYCAYGRHGEKPSDPKLAFFEYRPNMPTDRYYCGCYGYD